MVNLCSPITKISVDISVLVCVELEGLGACSIPLQRSPRRSTHSNLIGREPGDVLKMFTEDGALRGLADQYFEREGMRVKDSPSQKSIDSSFAK